MAWRVALVFDTEFSVEALSSLVHQMPVWALETPRREAAAPRIREEAGEIWTPDPAFTLFKTYDMLDREELCRNILLTVIEHHPRLATLDLIGISPSPKLTAILDEADFTSVTRHNLRFRKRLSKMEYVRDLVLDASFWKTEDDIYESFFKAVGAPVWHGRNFDALRDSIVTGSINEIELPYRIIIENLAKASSGALEPAMNFAELIKEFEMEGHAVEIKLR